MANDAISPSSLDRSERSNESASDNIEEADAGSIGPGSLSSNFLTRAEICVLTLSSGGISFIADCSSSSALDKSPSILASLDSLNILLGPLGRLSMWLEANPASPLSNARSAAISESLSSSRSCVACSNSTAAAALSSDEISGMFPIIHPASMRFSEKIL